MRRRLSAAVLAISFAGVACGSGGGGDPGEAGSEIALVGTDALAFDPTSVTAAAGTVTIELTAQGAVEHTVVIEELGDRQVVAADPGQTATGTVDLEAGTYTFYCSVTGHREAGMEGELTVS